MRAGDILKRNIEFDLFFLVKTNIFFLFFPKFIHSILGLGRGGAKSQKCLRLATFFLFFKRLTIVSPSDLSTLLYLYGRLCQDTVRARRGNEYYVD